MQPKKCEHNIPETLKGSGPCVIINEVKKRNGTAQWWCTTHAQEAGDPTGNALDACPGSWFDEVPSDRQLEIDAEGGHFSVWGAVSAAITYGEVPVEQGGVHVHQRPSAGGPKEVDGSYDIVKIRGENGAVVDVETMAARAYSVSELTGQAMKAMKCPKPACGFAHIDELKFATKPHVKHQCNGCGRNFWDSEPSISNPLATAADELGIAETPPPVRVTRPLDLASSDYSALAMWPSNRAILTNRTEPEDEGIHVHAWNEDGDLVLDETYWPVSLDGQRLGLDEMRALSVQRELAHGAPITCLPCTSCGSSLLSPSSGWIEPQTTHECASCGATTKTRRRVFINPLADKGSRV